MTSRISEFLEAIVGDRNPWSAPDRHAEVPAWIAGRWRSLGVAVEVHEFDVDGTTGRNVWVPPGNPNAGFVLVMAHHDTVPNCPGADDNGSGVAVVDAVVRELAAGTVGNVAAVLVDFEEGHPARWRERDSWPGPEDGAFRAHFAARYGGQPLLFPGAHHLHEHLGRAGLVDHLQVVLNFETVGWTAEGQQIPGGVEIDQPPPGNFVAIVANEPAGVWMSRIAEHAAIPTFPLLVPEAGHAIPDTRRSDHAVFWDAGLPAIMLTDTAEMRNPHYHQPSDTEVDLEFLSGVVETALAALRSREGA